jgi:hypothetical protein
MLPQKGESSMVTNIEIDVMIPIKALEPVFSYTQYPIATLYITSPIVLIALPCKSRIKSLFHKPLRTKAPPHGRILPSL